MRATRIMIRTMLSRGQRALPACGKSDALPGGPVAVRDRPPRDPVGAATLALGDDPRPPGDSKLAGRIDVLPIGVGDWRLSMSSKTGGWSCWSWRWGGTRYDA
jgi:hypothetical protein